METTILFAFWGYGSEYNLSAFEEYVQHLGYSTIKLPKFGLSSTAEIELLRGNNIILVTSAHFTRDKQILAELYPEIQISNSFLELIAATNPLVTAFYPHDLATPLVLNEPDALSCFDIVLWPTPRFGYTPKPKNLVTVGWTGLPETPRTEIGYSWPKKVWFFSDFVAHRDGLGVKATLNKLSPILKLGISIKFPLWPGHEEYETAFRSAGFDVIPAHYSTGQAILHCDLVISNGISSISIESSYMGKPVINLFEDYMQPGLVDNFLQGLAGCRIVRYQDFASALESPPPPPLQRIHPFSHQQALDALLKGAQKAQGKRFLSYPFAPPKTDQNRSPISLISFVICSSDNDRLSGLARWIEDAVSFPHEIVVVRNPTSISVGYNKGLLESKGDCVVFCLDDISILSGELFAIRLLDHLKQFDLVGVAGSTALSAPFWQDSNPSDIAGLLIQNTDEGKFGITVLDIAPERIVPVKVLDGVILAMRREVAEAIGFDEGAFEMNLGHDIDFCYRSHKAGYTLGASKDLFVVSPLKRISNVAWNTCADRLIKKFPELTRNPTPHSALLAKNAISADSPEQVRSICDDLLSGSFEFNSAHTKVQSDFVSIVEYSEWLNCKADQEVNNPWLAAQIAKANESSPIFNIIIEVGEHETQLLADTIDSLTEQYLTDWHLDIVTTLPSPDGLDETPCINWHTLAHSGEFKETLDFLVDARKHDWIMTLPVGAKLAPRYLLRVFEQTASHPDAIAVFVDDDCRDALGQRYAPRFKPGVNPAAIQSSDLAGPICVRREHWLATDGASDRHGSPWFSKLLKLAEKFGWASIIHIPDILITYYESFPSDTESCILALVQGMQRNGIDSEIVPVSGRSWVIRYPLLRTPSVSIAILSIGQLDLLSRCVTSIIEKTNYPNFEIIIALTNLQGAPDLDRWLDNIKQTSKHTIRIVLTNPDGNYATRCNVAARESSSDFLLFVKEESVVIQEKWLEELVRTCSQTGVGGVSPRIIQPGSAMIESAGSVLGLNGIVGSPYQGQVKLGEDLGYLDGIYISRDVSTLPAACMLIRKDSYLISGGMDEGNLGNHLAETDLCLKIRRNGERLIYQPLSNIVSSDVKEAQFDIDPSHVTAQIQSETHAKLEFSRRWYPKAAVDTFWNPALSLTETVTKPELEYQAQWQTSPNNLPRILAHPVPNGQGDFRITSPLKALSQAGMASECVWRQRAKGNPRFHSVSEIIRLAPDSLIVQNYIVTPALAALQEWNMSGCRPFTVYALDDLITDMDPGNPFRKEIPANARARLQYALKRCDRMVVSTEYLADAYRGFAPEIRVVPNRLEQAPWLSLRSLRRTGSKPRIGWAGGTTHHGDLLLLKEIIEQTCHEADWIFFGMCPDEIRPLLAEFHRIVNFSEYPDYLASLNLDLAVAPLAQTPFNRGKSNLRLLDYGVLGIPVVCTDIEPYRNSPACRVNNSITEWTEAIRARIYDPVAREREGDALRRWVLDGYILENHLEEWLEAHLPG
jgi:GT2 family glycosyltransferase